MDKVECVSYDAPRLVETFEALEVMGAAEGQSAGNGSQTNCIICVAS
jgi:hypothetical protein